MTGAARRAKKVAKSISIYMAIVAMLVTSSAALITTALVAPAGATLPGSTFDGSNGILDTSPPASMAPIDTTDPVGNADNTVFSNGAKEDDVCPGVGGGAPGKDDIDHFYMASERNANGTFVYLAWHRASTNGTTTIDFELNQSKLLNGPPACNNGANLPQRTQNDILVTYDFSGGGANPTLSYRQWNGTNTAGSWGPPQSAPNPAVAAEGKTNASGDFGETVLNITALLAGSPNPCETFTSGYAKSRSSTSFGSQMKDFTAVSTITIPTCGSIPVHKVDDAAPAANVPGAVFTLFTDVANAPGVSTGNTCTTDASGLCTIQNVPPGTYWVVETTTPAGYVTAAPQKVTVAVAANNPPGTLTFVDNRKPATINITKKDDLGNNLAGAVMQLLNDNAGVPGGAVAGKNCTTTAAGTCSITGILPAGTYWVRETTTPAGYQTAADQKVTVGLDQTVTLNFVDPRMPANINIIKQDDNGANVGGATFQLFNDNGGVKGLAVTPVKACTTTAAGTCSITNILPPGVYWVSETVTPAGYTGAPDQKVTLGLGQTVTMTFVNTRIPASVNIIKHDDLGANLAGAGFTLFTDVAGAPGVAVAGKNCTTAANGTCSITNILPPGTYWLRETTTPAGYTTAPDQQVTLALNQSVTLTFVDNRQGANVNILKKDDAVPAAPLQGAVFTLFTNVGGAPGVAVAGKNCTTAANGTCSITNILPPGTYWVVETTTPAGYGTAPSQQVVLGLNQTVGLNFVDPRQSATVNIHKQDDAAAALAGAVFQLLTDVAGNPGVPVPGKTCTTAANGDCTIGNILPPGTYWVSETTTPAGYTTAADQKVVLALNSTVNLTFVDPRQPATINITKTDDNNPAAPLQGAVFGLFTDNGGVIGNAVAGKTCTTSAAGTCSITGILPPGTYWVSETTVPTGYTKAADQKVTVGLGSTVPLTFVDNRKPATIVVNKANDLGAALANAGFSLFTDNGGVIGTAVAGKTCTTNANGTCSITGILPPGTYWVRETTVPAGHSGAADQKVTVGLDQTVTINFVNNRQASVTVTKVTDTGANLAGAGFSLFTDNGGVIGTPVAGQTCTTGANGQCTISNIQPGTYWLRETTTPAGFFTAPDQKFTAGIGQNVALRFVDNTIPPPIPPTVGMTLGKTVNGQHPDQNNPLVVETGTQLNYVLTITNTGQTPITITQLSDSLQTPLPASCAALINTTVQPGAKATCSYSSTPTTNAHNVATAGAVDNLGRVVTGKDETFVTVIHPGIKIVKAGPTNAHVGDTVTYTFTVTNSGDVPLSNVTVTDPKCNTAPALQSKNGGNQDNLLDPPETWIYTCTHVVTAADGTSLVNTAIAGGQDPLQKAVSSQDTHTLGVQHPAITIVKTASPDSVTAGGQVTYSYLVTNTGDVTLTNVTVTDDILGPIGVIPSMGPGTQTTLTKTVTVQANSPVTNIATVTGTDPSGKQVTATATKTISIVLGESIQQETVTPEAPPAPVELPKTGADANRELRVALGLMGIGAALVLIARRRRQLRREQLTD